MIVYDPTVPDEVRAAIDPILSRHTRIIPDWCFQLTINFSDGGHDGEYNASASPNFPYRRASLWFYAGWLLGTPAQRERDIVHELFHLVTAADSDYVLRIIRECVKDKPELREHLITEYKEYLEGVVQDFANLYYSNRLQFPKG